MKTTIPRAALSAVLLALCAPALAHPGAEHAAAAASLAGVAEAGWGAAFAAGFAHPFTGLDHLLAMLAVGLWSAGQQRGGALPAVFLGAMLLGALSGVAGLGIPGLETGIAATVLVIGGLVASAARLPPVAASAAIAVFAVLHGNAHGHELPLAASAAGFLAASGLLMLAGRRVGQAAAGVLVRLAGGGVAAAGVLLMVTR